MKNLLRCALLLAIPGTAFAGIGSTVRAQPDSLGALMDLFDAFGDSPAASPSSIGFTYPSLDWRTPNLVIQIHALETVDILVDEELYLGGNVWLTPLSAPLGGSWEAFGGIGGSLDVTTLGGDFALAVGPVAPIGVRTGTEAQFALYAMPGLYIAASDNGTDLVPDGSLFASIWF